MSKVFDLGSVMGPQGSVGPRGPQGPPGEVPENGIPGQVLTRKGEYGYEWADISLSSVTIDATNADIEAMLASDKFCYLHEGDYYLPLIWRKSASSHYFGGYVLDNATNKSLMVTYRCQNGVWQSEAKDDTAFLDSPAFTGTPTAPTAVAGTDTAQVATTAFVQQELDEIAVDGLLQGDGDGNITAAPTISSLEIDNIIDHIAPGIGPDEGAADYALIAVPVISSLEIDAIIGSLS